MTGVASFPSDCRVGAREGDRASIHLATHWLPHLVKEPSGVPTTGKVGSLFLNDPAREDTPTELPS